MGNWVKTGQPCPCGKSSDALATDSNGDSFCFRGDCGKYFKNGKEQGDYEDLTESDFRLEALPHRGIKKGTFEKFNVQVKFNKEQPIEIGFPYPVKDGLSWKVRPWGKKEFFTKGDYKSASLFGKSLFDKGSKRVITLFEGEYDAMSAFEIIGNESATVSIRSSTFAKLDCTKEYEYVNSFEKIVVCFDSDLAGQEAAKRVLSLFDFKKTFNLVLDKHKDCNAYIYDQNEDKEIDDRKSFYEAWKGVRRHTPDNIISGKEEFRKALESTRESRITTYPFEELTNKLFGFHRGEVIVIKAMEGQGKTEVFRSFEDHIFKTTKTPVGIIHLEEDNGTTLRGIAAYYEGIPSHLPDSPVSNEEVLDVLDRINATGNNEDGRIYLRSAFDVEDEDEFIGGIRFLVSGCGCDVVFLDHISWLATGTDDQDERKKLDRISQRLKLLAKELNFCLVMISHVNDDGKTRGSRNISKVGNTIIEISRNVKSEEEQERLKTYFMIEKARLIGAKEGPAGYALYDPDLCLLKDPHNENIKF
jgi:twinkle protein